jgi:dTDP-4-amino-4,6-dideoxygalactose transaminase
VPEIPDYAYHAFYKLYIFLQPLALKSGWNRERILQQINQAGVPCSTGGLRELYREKAFAAQNQSQQNLPVAEELANTSLMFLVHPTLSVEHTEWMGNIITRILKSAAR